MTRDHYAGGLRLVDFAQDPKSARDSINSWVEEKTRGKIKDLLNPSDLSGNTRLVLTNALFFKASWRFPFPKEGTKEAPFHVAPGQKVSVPMMHARGYQFNYFAGSDFQLLELPYEGRRFALLVLLPQPELSVQKLEESLTAAKLAAAVSNLKMHRGDVVLPLFKVNLRFKLNEDLSALGMPTAFSELADFSGMAPGQGLRISRVVHKAYIAVDEDGTEAAAATAVIMNSAAYLPFTFRADRPFLFFLRDRQTGSTLFIGRVTQPQPGK